MMSADMDAVEAENQVELEEKTRLINQVLELQHTLEDLSARVDAVKEENLKLKSENQVLGQYIENLMSASSVFQTTDTKSKRKGMLIELDKLSEKLIAVFNEEQHLSLKSSFKCCSPSYIIKLFRTHGPSLI
uniref:Short coiled-coil protein n=1 Tax=Salvator merianae TaxID=96440 RepID=A0A8D0E1V1_SALMN